MSREPQPGELVGHYEILEEIGHGGMGVVYRARDLILGREVALKRPAPDLEADSQVKRRFMRESHAASKLSHPSIVPIFEVFEDAGVPWLAMQLVKGPSLRERLAERGALSLREVLRHGVELTEALQAAHKAHIIHRDVNPRNIIINDDGHALLADFGLAGYYVQPAEASQESTQSTLTKPGTQLGTPAYMSPEQALGRALDVRSDLFALGAVLYEMCSGRPAFAGESGAETLDNILNQAPVPLARLNYEVPAEMERIIRKALAKNRDERYQETQDMLVDLQALRRRLQHDSWEQTHPAVPPRRRGGRARRLVLAASALAAVAVIIWMAWETAAPEPVSAEHGPLYMAAAPFVDLTGDLALQYLCPGVRETIVTKLAGLSGIFILPEESDVEADLFLEGAVQKEGNTLRVSYRVRYPRMGRMLSSGVVNGGRQEFFRMQDQAAGEIAATMEAEFGDAVQYTPAPDPTADLVAYDAYLRGRDLMRRPDEIDNLNNAIESFKLALSRDPGFAHAQAGLAEAYWHNYRRSGNGKWIESARESGQQAIALQPGLAVARMWMGTILHELGQYEEAVASFLVAIDLDPTREATYRQLGRSRLALGNPEAAEETFLEAVRLHPDYWAGHAYLGGFYGVTSRYHEAAAAYERAIQLAPKNAPALLRLGGIYLYMGRYEAALDILDRSLAIQPSFKALQNKASVLARLRRFDEAIAANELAASFADADFILYGSLARVCYWAGRREKARITFARAISMGEERLEINPRNADAHIMLASYHAMLDHRDQAMEHLETALRLQPDQPEFFFWAGVVHNQFGDEAGALDWIGKAMDSGYSLADIEITIELDNLRKKPQFKALLARQASDGNHP